MFDFTPKKFLFHVAINQYLSALLRRCLTSVLVKHNSPINTYRVPYSLCLHICTLIYAMPAEVMRVVCVNCSSSHKYEIRLGETSRSSHSHQIQTPGIFRITKKFTTSKIVFLNPSACSFRQKGIIKKTGSIPLIGQGANCGRIDLERPLGIRLSK